MPSSDAKRQKPRRFRLGLLARLVLSFALGGVLLNGIGWHIAMPRFMESQGMTDQTLPPPHEAANRVRKADVIIEKFLRSPTSDYARNLAGTEMMLRYQGPAGDLSSGTDTPGWDVLDLAGVPYPPDARYRVGPHYVSRKLEGGRVAVFFPEAVSSNALEDPGFRMLFTGQLLVAILLCLIFSAWQFRPLGTLTHAANRMASGDLSARVPVTQSSELGDLASAFNHMADRIQWLVRSREELLADISHELRSPLTRVRLALELGGEENKQRIERNLLEMEGLIEQLLESHRLSRTPNVARFETFDGLDLVREVLGKYASRGRQFTVLPRTGNFALSGDRRLLGHVLSNLIDNSLKYSESPIEITLDRGDGETRVSVSDRGPGVPEAELTRIFDPFHRVDPSRTKTTGGFGLGLDLCRRVAEAHKGTIQARNREGGGLEVILSLPLEKPQ